MTKPDTQHPEVIWECKIGGPVPGEMPSGWDAPLRRAVQAAFLALTGVENKFTFSGRGQLTEMERAVVEKRAPTPAASGAAPALPKADGRQCLNGVWMDAFTAEQMTLFGNQQFNAGREFESERLAALASREASPAPLTDERIAELWIEHGLDEDEPEGFARVIEREVRAALASPQVAPAPKSLGPVWYMRDNHTFRALTGGPEEMVDQCLEEFDAGYTSGMLCSKERGITVHASGKARRDEFRIAALAALAAAAPVAPQDDARDAARSQHDADSRELRSLCEARDEARRERDLLKVEVAALGSCIGHMSRLIDELQPAHDRYQYLRERPLDAINVGGVFAGLVPDNVVLNGEDLDRAVDAALLVPAAKPTEHTLPTQGDAK